MTMMTRRKRKSRKEEEQKRVAKNKASIKNTSRNKSGVMEPLCRVGILAVQQ